MARVESSSLDLKITELPTSRTNIGQIASCAYGSSSTRPLTVMITFQWGFNQHRGSASVVFPLEVWLLILENLALRDLYSLTVTSKFFYSNFISIYLNRHPGSASVVFPVEIWMLILGNLALRDLYSLTVTSKFFYNNFTSLYRNRVAHEGIPRRKRPDSPTQARTRNICSWMPPLSFLGTDFLNNRVLCVNLHHFAH